MTFNATGQNFNICVDNENNLWESISLNNLASDTYCADGVNVESRLGTMKTQISNLETNKQNASTAITTSNIGSQSVNYAASAGNADTVDGKHFSDIQADAQTKANNALTSAKDYASSYAYSKTEIDSAFNTRDSNIDSKLSKSGGAMNGDLNMNNHNVMGTLRVQAPNGEPLFLAGGFGNGAPDGDVVLLGDGVECWNANQTSLIDISCHQLHYQEACAVSSKLVKENVENLTEEEAKKILDVDFVTFDYKKCYGGKKGKRGVIAEQVLNIIPSCVNVPEGYNEDEFDESKGMHNKILGVNYLNFIPYLGKMIQIQEIEINNLKQEIANLKAE